MKDRQCNVQKKKNKKTNIGRRNTRQKTEDFSYKQAANPLPPLENWISNGNTDINKLWKICSTDSLALKKTTYYHKNEWLQINMSSIIAGSILGVQFPHMAKCIQYNTMWYSLRDFQQVSGFPDVTAVQES